MVIKCPECLTSLVMTKDTCFIRIIEMTCFNCKKNYLYDITEAALYDIPKNKYENCIKITEDKTDEI